MLVLHQNVLLVWAKNDLLSLLQSKPSQQIIPQVGNQYTGTGYCLFTTPQQWPFSHSRPPDDKDNNVLCSTVYCNHLTWLKGQEEFAKLNNTRWQLLLHFTSSYTAIEWCHCLCGERNYWGDLSQSRNSPHFMEPEGSLPLSQVPATCPYSEPSRSSPYPNIPLPEDPS